MINKTHNFGGGPVARTARHSGRPLPEVEAPPRAGDRPGGEEAHRDPNARRRARTRVRHGEVNPSAAPLSSATFITQHIAQERMPARAADPRHGTRSYDHRALRPIQKSDLIRRA